MYIISNRDFRPDQLVKFSKVKILHEEAPTTILEILA